MKVSSPESRGLFHPLLKDSMEGDDNYRVSLILSFLSNLNHYHSQSWYKMNFARTCLLLGPVPHGCKRPLRLSFILCLFVCFWFFVPIENFSLIWKVTIAGEGLQSLTYFRHSWPLSSEVLQRATPTVTRGIRL